MLTIVVALVWISLATTYFTYTLNTIQLKEQDKNLEEITKSNAIEISYTMDKYVQVLMSAVAFIETYEDASCDEVINSLSSIVSRNDFTRLAIDYADGTGYTSDRKKVDVSVFNYGDKIRNGEPFVIDVVNALVDGVPVISVLVPIKGKDGSYEAALRGTIATDKFSQMLEETFSKGGGYFYIVDGSGRYVAKSLFSNDLFPDEASYFELIDKLTFNQGYSAQMIRELFSAKQKGMSKYAYQGQEHYCYIEPTTVNGWMVVTVVPKEIVRNSVNSHALNVVLFVVQLVAVFLFFIFYIYTTQRRSKALLSQNQEKLSRLAYYDEFTGAPTLARFKLEAQRFIEENKDKKLLLVKLDIKEFKLVNQILGDQIGDAVIINLASALKANTLPDYELYARLHDDEFLVFHTYETPNDALQLRTNFKKLLFIFMGLDFTYDLRIVAGHYYMSEDNCFDVSEAIEKANIAHRRAKQTGREICVYDKEFIRATLKQKDVENRAEKGMENREFKVYLQGKYELENETIVGAEALVRWIDDTGKITYPNDFIPLFEQNGFITTLDFYMFEETCKIINGWMESGIKPVPVSVNFSRLHLFDSKFLKRLSTIARRHNVPPHYLEVELTETIVMDAQHDLAGLINALHECGFMVSMDDFGTGYSSLGMLKNLNVDIIKLDRSFFLEAHENVKSHSILSNMLNMAIDLGIKTVAEGVEEQEHVDLLRKLNCDVIQGYYFCKPIPYGDFTQVLHKVAAAPSSVVTKDLHRHFNLRKNNELLTDMMDSMPLAFALWNKDITIVQCNKEAAALLGFNSDQAFVSKWRQVIPESQPDGQLSLSLITQQIQDTFDSATKRQFTWTLRHCDGTRLPCEATLVRIFNKGEFMIACYLRDMRLQLENENTIKQEYEKLKMMMDASPLCFNLWDEQMQNTMCNTAAVTLFGLENEQENLTRFFELSPEYQPDGRPSLEKAQEYIQLAFELGGVAFEWMHQKLDGEPIPAEVTLNRIELHGKHFIAGFTRDLRKH